LRVSRSVFLAATTVLLVAALAAFGLQLRASQADSREDLLDRFDSTSTNIAALTESLFGSTVVSSAPELTEEFGGEAIDQKALDARATEGNSPYAIVGDADGQVLAATKGAPNNAQSRLSEPHIAAALGEQGYGLSDLVESKDGETIEIATGFDAGDERRVFVSAVDPGVLSLFLGGYLDQTDRLEGSHAYITDSAGGVIASTSGAPDPSESDLQERFLADEEGGYGTDRHFSSEPVEGSGWLVVQTVSNDVLLASVTGANRWVPWLVFAFFAVAAGTALFLVRRAMKDSEQIKKANERLAVSNEELNRRARELKRSNEELEQFASIASHDLSEPLRKVQMFSKQLQESEGDRVSDQGRDYLARMVSAGERMQSLVEDLLDFSRVTTRGRPFTRVDLGEVFRAVVSDLEISLSEEGGEVQVASLPTVQADPLQMRQLAQNLIANGVKFHREGVPPKIQVEGEVRNNKARITVTDNGIGFDERYAERIFRVFERLHGRNAFPGTGIGLALCRKIAERHGGTIVAESTPGEGSTFTVTLLVSHAARLNGNGAGPSNGAGAHAVDTEGPVHAKR
jgi:signal transduction histidine kinase